VKRIVVPTRSGSDWQRLLAKPKLHWKKGASAMTAAAAWEAAADALPPEIKVLLESSKEECLQEQRLLIALPEWQVSLEGGETTSNTDVLAICRNDTGLCVIGVEAKVLEDFGPLLSEKRKEASPGQLARLTYLHALLKIEHFEDAIRYQLLHRTVSALLTAQQFHAESAVMLVHAFDCPPARREDFRAFVVALGAKEIAPFFYRVLSFNHPRLYLTWCDGDSQFRQVELPSSL
jgi:hypothetical protein